MSSPRNGIASFSNLQTAERTRSKRCTVEIVNFHKSNHERALNHFILRIFGVKKNTTGLDAIGDYRKCERIKCLSFSIKQK